MAGSTATGGKKFDSSALAQEFAAGQGTSSRA